MSKARTSAKSRTKKSTVKKTTKSAKKPAKKTVKLSAAKTRKKAPKKTTAKSKTATKSAKTKTTAKKLVAKKATRTTAVKKKPQKVQKVIAKSRKLIPPVHMPIISTQKSAPKPTQPAKLTTIEDIIANVHDKQIHDQQNLRNLEHHKTNNFNQSFRFQKNKMQQAGKIPRTMHHSRGK